jgi:hypothetical protein
MDMVAIRELKQRTSELVHKDQGQRTSKSVAVQIPADEP